MTLNCIWGWKSNSGTLESNGGHYSQVHSDSGSFYIPVSFTYRSVLQLNRAAANFEETQCQKLTAARERHRRVASAVITTTDFQCPHWLCSSGSGLQSHLRVHRWVVEHKLHRVRWTITTYTNPGGQTLLFQIRTGLLIPGSGAWWHEERDIILKSLCKPYYVDATPTRGASWNV